VTAQRAVATEICAKMAHKKDLENSLQFPEEKRFCWACWIASSCQNMENRK
jgi:hypothetical protein